MIVAALQSLAYSDTYLLPGKSQGPDICYEGIQLTVL